MQVLSLDMTLNNTGYTVWKYERPDWRFVDGGLIRPVANKKQHHYKMMLNMDMCVQVYTAFDSLLKKHNFQMIVVELLTGSKTASTALTFGLVAGVLASFAYTHGLPVHAYYSENIKLYCTGKKSAS